jgi:dipeptidase E
MMRKEGYDFEELDIEGKNENELRESFKDKNAIYVEGGNTFYLLKAVRESGFDKVIKDLIKKGVVYIGSSAGSYIMCPTIEMSTWKKPGEEKDRFGIIDLTALNQVPFLVKAHYNSEQKEFFKEKIASAKYPTRILKDGQAILVEGENYKLVGDGEEIKL